MSSGPDISTLTLAILGLIARSPCSAYDVKKVFQETPIGRFSSSPGAIYPAIKRIERSGWIHSRVANANTLRPKRVYRISKKGRQALAERLLQPLTRDDITRNLDDVMLRFVFMDKLLGTGQIIEFMRRFKSEMEANRSSLEELLELISETITVCERLSMEHGIAAATMNIAWASRALERLRAK